MSAAQALTGSIAANTVQKWLRAWHTEGVPDAVDLEIVRQMLPSTPYGAGVREIKAPMVLDIDSCEGMLVRNPKDTAEWGIFYNGKAISISPPSDRPRHAHQEIADLLAAALLRLRARPPRNTIENSDCVRLGFPGQQRVNANPDHYNGVRP